MAKAKKKPVKKTHAKAKKKPAFKAVKKSASKKSVAKKIAPKKLTSKKVVAKKPLVKKVTKKPEVKPAKKLPYGFPEKLRDVALKIIDERQGEEVVTINLIGRSSIADYLIIATGRNARQVAAMADHLRHGFTQEGIKQIRLEGRSEGNWILVDGGDVVVHLFRPEVRSYYKLEEMLKA